MGRGQRNGRCQPASLIPALASLQDNTDKGRELTVDYMSELLGEAQINSAKLFFRCIPRARCLDIMKSLIVFVAENPPSVAANLFKSDQLSRVNPFKVDELDLLTRRNRNWQYILSKIVAKNVNQPETCWALNYPLIMLTLQKTNAINFGKTMEAFANSKDDLTPECLVPVIIGFWIAKLYSVSIYRADPTCLPEPICRAYEIFLIWKGKVWGSKPIVMNFNDGSVMPREDLMNAFPFTSVQSVPKTTVMSLAAAMDLEALRDKLTSEEAFIIRLCRYIGEDILRQYLFTAKTPFPDFFVARFGFPSFEEAVALLKDKTFQLNPETEKMFRTVYQVLLVDGDDASRPLVKKPSAPKPEAVKVNYPGKKTYKKSDKEEGNWKLRSKYFRSDATE